MKANTPAPRMLPLALIICAATQISGATTFLWNQSTAGSNNWNVNANWSPSTGNPGSADTAVFGLVGTVSASNTVNNVVSVNTTVNTLQYTNNGSGIWNVTQIPAGVTLTVNNNLTVGGTTFGSANGSPALAALFGGGNLLVTGNTLTIGQGTSANQITGNTLDLSGLSNFTYSAVAGTVNLGNGSRSAGVFNLAAISNSITAANLNLQTGQSSSSVGGTVNLGPGTNLINATNINVAAGSTRGSCTVQFQGPTGGLRIRGGSGTANDRATMTVANRATGGSLGTTTGNLFFNGHPVDLMLKTLTLGEASSANANIGTGVLQFDTGTLNATNILMAVCSATGSGSQANGTLTVGTNATCLVGPGGISMVNQTAGASTGIININNGALTCTGSIFKATSAGTASIYINGGTLSLAGATNTVGTTAIPLDNLEPSNSVISVPVTSDGPAISVTTLSINGTTDIVNVASIPGVVPPAQFVLIKYSSLNGTFDFGLGTLPGTYQGFISNNVNNSSVDLVITGSAAKNLTWNGTAGGTWDLTSLNWLYSGSPANYLQGDFVTFDDTLTGTASVTMTTNVAPGGISFNNSASNYVVSGAYQITGPMLMTKNGAGTVRLSESGGDNFSGGITVNAGTLILDDAGAAISGGLAINAGTVQIGNNDTSGALPLGSVIDDGVLAFDQTGSVTVSTAISGTGSLVQMGSGTVTLTADNTYTNDTDVDSGILALSGAGSVADSAAVEVTGGAFDVTAANQPATVNALNLTNGTINLAPNANASANILCGSLAFGGATNKISVVSLPAIASFPVTFTLVTSTNTPTGTFNVGLAGALPNGDSGFVSLSGNSVLLTVTSGTVGTRPQVVWTGDDLANSDTNWSDRLNWQLPGAPTATDNVLFNGTGSQAASELSTPGGGAAALALGNVNNIVDANFNISTLTFTNVGSYHNTWINNGLTLNITNTLTVGSESADFGNAAEEFVAVAGTNGTLQVNNTNGTFFVGTGTASSGGSGHGATLDLSALGTFNAAVSRFLIGVGSTAEGISQAREVGVIYLAQTNTITATVAVSGTETSDTSGSVAGLAVGDNDGNGSETGYLYLGQTNAIFADGIVVGRQKQTGSMLFNPAFTNASAYFRGRDGVSPVSVWSVGDGVVNGGTTTLGATNDFTGGTVNALVSTMYIGRAANSTAGSGTTAGTVALDDGVLNAGTIYLGLEPTNNTGKHGVGTLNVVSNDTTSATARLIVSGSLNMGFEEATSDASSFSTLSITNGTVQAYSIVPGTNTASATAVSINIAGGTLVVTNPVGSAAAPLGTLTLASLGVPGNSATALYLPARTNSSGITVIDFNIDGSGTTTNIINVESVGPIGATPVELPLITYTTETLLNGGSVTNLGLGTLPTGYAGYLTNDTANSLVGVVLTSAIHPRPVFTSLSVQGTNLAAGGVNGFANVPYTLLSATNVTQPLSSWTTAGTGIFGPTGNFSISTSSATNAQQFFLLRVP